MQANNSTSQAGERTQITVRKMTELKSRNFGIYCGNQLLEGGFFSKAAAQEAATRDYSAFTFASMPQEGGPK